jgi:antitoxin component YwqK of YwqJK toxin-antitoxin module
MKNITLGAMLAFFLAGTLSAQTLAQLEQSDYTILENNDSQVTYYADNADYKINSAGKVSAQIMSFHQDGSLEERGALLEGQKHGAWTKYDESGNLMSSGSYVLGQKDGKWKVWEGNVLRVEMEYNKGQRAGTWKMYDANGNLTAEKTY